MSHKLPTLSENIFFDLDNTLIDRQKAVQSFAASKYSNKEQCQKFLWIDAWGYKCRQQFAEELSKEGLINSKVDLFLSEFYHFMRSFDYFEATTEKLLKKLQEGFDLYLVSNGSITNQMTKLKKARLNQYFKDLFISEEVTHDKSEPAFWQYVLEKTAVDVNRSVIIGDSAEHDIYPAAKLGFKTVWLSKNRIYPNGQMKPDAVINNLEEIYSWI
ncbi:MAG: HAD family hydrolase [Lentisphaerales bacterium]|nr:HAD family hydrolase [Lentisphaerales bacterium]